MKKIMFNDKYGLTKSVLEGHKTMTRRLVQSNNIVEIKTSDGVIHNVDGSYGSYHEYRDKDGKAWLAWSPYKVGEIVAIAQSYMDCGYNGEAKSGWCHDENEQHVDIHFKEEAGWNNKMFVRSELMKHHIRITEIKLEPLQDCSDDDILKEGIYQCDEFEGYKYYRFDGWKFRNGTKRCSESPKEAFAALIDKVSGKGTWESNPWVFVYTFKLID